MKYNRRLEKKVSNNRNRRVKRLLKIKNRKCVSSINREEQTNGTFRNYYNSSAINTRLYVDNKTIKGEQNENN